jgi:hypothetical protein
LQTPRACGEGTAPEDKLQNFLGEVLEIDLTKYNVTNTGSSSSYPSYYGGLVKEEGASFNLESDLSKVSVQGEFLNDVICQAIVYPMQGSMIFLQPPSTNALDESRRLLKRYHNYAGNLGLDISHVTLALSMLSTVNVSNPNPDLYMLNNIAGFIPSVTVSGNMKQETTQTGVRWSYSEKGVDMPSKCLAIDFGSSELLFADTWNLYTVGSFSAISEDEAKSIGWKAAENYDLVLVYENGTLFSVHPDWTDMTYQIAVNMIPGQIYKQLPEDNFVDPGNVTRDPLALYPLWQMVFYFHENIGDTVGIQVGVWGDSKEVAYISEYGYLDPYVIPTPVPEIAPIPTPTMPNMGPTSPPSYPDFYPELVFGAILLPVAITVGIVLWLYFKKLHGSKSS